MKLAERLAILAIAGLVGLGITMLVVSLTIDWWLDESGSTKSFATAVATALTPAPTPTATPTPAPVP